MKQTAVFWKICVMVLLTAAGIQAQLEGLHGDFLETRNGLHAGNQFRTTFYNDGSYGSKQRPPDIAGEWPINSAHDYLLDGNTFVGSEVIDTQGELKHIFSVVPGPGDPADPTSVSRGDASPDGDWWAFLPLPGFANPDTNKAAMSKWKWSWPVHWPDKWDDPVDPGWVGSWNGYFGKNVFNADEESYFMCDDYANAEFKFFPDSTDSLRRGLGIRMAVRGFQWSNALVEDGIFILYDIQNIGTHNHDKMIFAYKIGNNMGDTETGWDSNDDNGKYNLGENLAYLYDYDDIGAGGWTPVGFFGGSMLETPGNPTDGIDNDRDGIMGSGPVITEDMFKPRTLESGEEIILTDYITFERTRKILTSDTITVHYQDLTFKYYPGKVVEENPTNLVDDNLNGLIDENRGSTVGQPPNEITRYLYVGAKYIDYFTGSGADNLLLDEKRDDGIDNDGDWEPALDDLGQDGAPFTHDPGEGDGIPTFGEPHFDKTDIDETDMLGLTSFTLYQWTDMPHWEDEIVWQFTVPGYLDDLMQNDNVELLWGSGYFPMPAGRTERFSMGLVAGINEDDIVINNHWFSEAYHENYNFAKAPNIPTVTAIAGNKKVTLMWDDFAEKSVDPIVGEDFEGYRIYRSTDPGWQDMIPITDGYGTVIYRKPLAQFDLKNNITGFAPVPLKGVQFDLGMDTGLTHTFVDTTVKNGFTYYYAVASYDRGDEVLGIPPTECTKFISLSQAGEIEEKGVNVVRVRPEAPVVGFIQAGFDRLEVLPGSTTDGSIALEMINPDLARNGDRYQVVFEDTIFGTGRLLYPGTKNMSLINITTGQVLIDRDTSISELAEFPVTEGFQLSLLHVYRALELDAEASGWNRSGIHPPDIRVYSSTRDSVSMQTGDFAIIFGEPAQNDTSTSIYRGSALLPAIPVNFSVYNLSTQKKMKFAFRDRDVPEGEDGRFTAYYASSRSDELIILTDDSVGGWEIRLTSSDTDTLQPEVGDTLRLITHKPFLSNDVFEFTMQGQRIEENLDQHDLDNIRVVPNPYIVANSWEPQNPYANGRGPRELHFINLPQKCTIRIFNVQGQLVNTLEHESENLTDGTYIWDMQTKDNLDIAYGIYLYHVDAGKIGSTRGKFAVIK
jgi:hypothetical protein